MTPKPGRTIISAPIKPITIADQRFTPIFSPSTAAPSKVTRNGAMKLAATASARATYRSANTNNSAEHIAKEPLPSCKSRLLVFRIAGPCQYSRNKTPTSRPICRNHIICTGCKESVSSLACISVTPNINNPTNISRMPCLLFCRIGTLRCCSESGIQ